MLTRTELIAVMTSMGLSVGYIAWVLFSKVKEVSRLRRDCSEAYQVIGAMADHAFPFENADVQRALDNLSAAANGRPRPHDDLLPWSKEVV